MVVAAGRDFQTNGATIVIVRGNGALANPNEPGAAGVWELGLSSEKITISPKFYHYDIHCDDFGPAAPVETMWNLAECIIKMTLVNYDNDVLQSCMIESMGGANGIPAGAGPFITAGTMQSAGTLMGGNDAIGTPNNHYISLNLIGTDTANNVGINLSKLFDYHFAATYLMTPPLEIPIGTEKTIVVLTWKAIPYQYYQTISTTEELKSQGTVVWDSNIDEGPVLNPFTPLED